MNLIDMVYPKEEIEEVEQAAESAPALTPLERLRRQMVKRGMIEP
jgi:hypothetical protein